MVAKDIGLVPYKISKAPNGDAWVESQRIRFRASWGDQLESLEIRAKGEAAAALVEAIVGIEAATVAFWADTEKLFNGLDDAWCRQRDQAVACATNDLILHGFSFDDIDHIKAKVAERYALKHPRPSEIRDKWARAVAVCSRAVDYAWGPMAPTNPDPAQEGALH